MEVAETPATPDALAPAAEMCSSQPKNSDFAHQLALDQMTVLNHMAARMQYIAAAIPSGVDVSSSAKSAQEERHGYDGGTKGSARGVAGAVSDWAPSKLVSMVRSRRSSSSHGEDQLVAALNQSRMPLSR